MVKVIKRIKCFTKHEIEKIILVLLNITFSVKIKIAQARPNTEIPRKSSSPPRNNQNSLLQFGNEILNFYCKKHPIFRKASIRVVLEVAF